MGVNIKGNTFVIERKPNATHFDSPIKVNNSLKHETNFIMKHFSRANNKKTSLGDYYIIIQI